MKLKLKKVIFLALMGTLTVALIACEAGNSNHNSNDDSSTTTDTALKNNFPLSHMSDYDIEGQHRFYDVTMYEALELRNDETFNGILYFGFPGCPWCQAAVPIMHEASQQTNTDIFYVNRSQEIRATDNWENWDIEMAWWLNDQIEMEWLYDEDGEPDRPNIFVPQVVHLKNGIVVDDHRGTFEGHEHIEDEKGQPYLPELTAAERATLLEQYIRIFSSVHVPEICPVETTRPNDEGCS